MDQLKSTFAPKKTHIFEQKKKTHTHTQKGYLIQIHLIK